MRAWRVGFGLVWVAAVAHAGWTTTQTQNGIPKDVVVFRPGFFAVATDLELFISQDGGVSSLSGGMAGSYLRGTNCVVGVRDDGTLHGVGGCSPDEGKSLFPDSPEELPAVRFSPDAGVGYAAAKVSPVSWEFRSSLVPKEGNAEWGTLAMPLPSAVARPQLAVLPPQADGFAHALFSVSPTKANFVWYRGTTAQAYPAQGVTPPNAARSVALLPGVDPAKPLAYFGNDTGLFRGTLGSTSSPFDPVPLDGGLMSVDALAFDVASGSNAGVGFGLMFVKQQGGQVAALSAEPVLPSAVPGSVWRGNPKFSTASNESAAQVACSGASYCVAIFPRPTQNIFIYENTARPVLNVTQPYDVAEGSQQKLPLDVVDNDGDAVRMTATLRDPSGLLTAVPEANPSGGNGLTLALTAASGFCASQTAFVDLVASDGLAAHDTTRTVALQVKHTRPPDAPAGAPESVEGGVFFAGGVRGTLTPRPGFFGCAPVKYLWESSTNPRAPKLETTDTVATLNPVLDKADRCKPGGNLFTYGVRANDGELTSALTPVQVTIHPWGPPEAPFATATREVYSGTALFPLQPNHVCAGVQGLPAVSTLWAVTDNPSNVAVTVVGSGAPVGPTPVGADSVLVSSQSCVDTALTLRAFNRITVEGRVLDGPVSDVQVKVLPRWAPLKTVALGLELDPPEERRVRGHVTTTPLLNCTSDRALTTVATLEEPESAPGVPGRVLATQTFAGVSDSFDLALPPTCGEASYTLRVRVYETLGTGAIEVSEHSQPYPRYARDVVLGDVSGEVIATCGEGARGTLRQTFPEGACTVVDLAWSHSLGPTLASLQSSGDMVEVATADTELESLVGEFITLHVKATAQGAAETTREHVVRIGARPFVTVERSTELATSSDSGQVGVVVTLRNDSACGVASLRYEEVATGAELLPDSVKLDGQRVTPTEVEGGRFTVAPVTLAAGATATLTYVVRPGLLSTPTYSGVAKLRDVAVSQPPAPPPSSSGCGCSGGGSGVTAFGLGALAWLARRRRGVRARS
ncbi:hypothetical protein D7V97_09065 [Corallococcus sp. CA053C]|uniref:MYXO-CTERM sorting domain-containing protein n=1 Tax=Corallococcus sp. CA053C TaxID=2316732 RepID=UPI000EA0CC28|nr:MYXO-CTERM sorting domain-containing protein [Corallococcus sp. CA053C]RKH12261.1 hypothetical protein D7V97_09065 [Corallococcus sp. CA053C]